MIFCSFYVLISPSNCSLFLSFLFISNLGRGHCLQPPVCASRPSPRLALPPQLPCKEKPSLSSWAAASCLGREAEGAPSGSLCTQQPQRCHSWPCGAERLRDHRIPSSFPGTGSGWMQLCSCAHPGLGSCTPASFMGYRRCHTAPFPQQDQRR